MGDDGKGQTNHHPAGIHFDGLIDKITDIRESENIIEPGICFVSLQTQNRRVHIDIFATGEFRIETGAKLQQRSHTPLSYDFALGRRQSSTDHLQ